MSSPDGSSPQISSKSHLAFSRLVFNDWSNHHAGSAVAIATDRGADWSETSDAT